MILDVPEDVPVIADAGLLERALANIVANAAAYSPADDPPRIVAGAVDGVDLRIVDRGPGVPAADATGCSSPSNASVTGRTAAAVGLGLAVAPGFVEAMGGAIEVEDTPGGGVT